MESVPFSPHTLPEHNPRVFCFFLGEWVSQDISLLKLTTAGNSLLISTSLVPLCERLRELKWNKWKWAKRQQKAWIWKECKDFILYTLIQSSLQCSGVGTTCNGEITIYKGDSPDFELLYILENTLLYGIGVCFLRTCIHWAYSFAAFWGQHTALN